ncbi:hypothetical protein AB0O76_34555 [Streptomyces sp. NPDC086554]|uniref:hypothetical protein n=1 Tax=Streptomyces sp. NPDC086554 TaxID=3154864 RepID=UPI003420A86C
MSAAPHDPDRAWALAVALAERALAEPNFEESLRTWHDTVKALHTGDVHNTVSGGSQGAVIQGRDFSGPVTFGSPLPQPRPPTTGGEAS